MRVMVTKTRLRTSVIMERARACATRRLGVRLELVWARDNRNMADDQ